MGTKIYNSDLTRELREGARIQTATDATPTEIADKVVPVMEVNPKLLRVINYNQAGAATNATSTSIVTLPLDKDIFVTNASLSFQKDVTATTTFIRLNGVLENGQTIVLLASGCLTLTVESHDLAISFPVPIKLKKGSSISVTASTNTGNFNAFASVSGYYVDNINA